MKTGAFGTSQRTQRAGAHLHSSLRKLSIQVLNDEQQKLKAARLAKAAEPLKTRAPKGKVLLTDDEVIECRTLHEVHGWSVRALARRYPKASEQHLINLLHYRTRAQPHLDPKPGGFASIPPTPA